MPIDMKFNIENHLEEALIEISKDEKRVAKAVGVFEDIRKRYLNKIEETVFNTWLLHHYKDSSGAIIDVVDGDEALVHAIKTSTLGFFSLHKDKKYYVFQDILTKKQYVVNESDTDAILDEQAIYFTRIYELKGSSYMSDDYSQFSVQDGKLIIKNLMSKYSETGTEKSYTIDGFIKENPMLLYWAANVISEVVEEEYIDYVCYEINCKIEDEAVFKAFLSSDEMIATDFDDVYSWHNAGSKRAEVVVDSKNVYIECALEQDFEWAQQVIELKRTGLVIFETKLTHMDELFDS